MSALLLHSFFFANVALANNNIATDFETVEDNANTAENAPIMSTPAVNEHIEIIGRKNSLRTEAGSATLLDEVTLERFDFDDIHRVLANVPGVNIREEDGYGLRPNIGFRGVTPERSKKINILEDGVLIGPAPYSAPAAYYFPSINRMTSVEVVKGPAAIKYGPNTVAGTLNMTTRAVPDYFAGQADVSFGSNGYQKLQAYVGDQFNFQSGDLGYLIEFGDIGADGFKDIDFVERSNFSKDSGFDKQDLMLKTRFSNSLNLFNTSFAQFFEIKLATSNETSNETYLGLTDEDFAATPYRRYAASKADKMDWEHEQFLFTHYLNNQHFQLTTRLYKNEFTRAWRKLNGFQSIGLNATDRTLQEIIAEPDEGINQDYYQILTGQKDSETNSESLIIGTNDRDYISKGFQSDLTVAWHGPYFEHIMNAGLRIHQDIIQRNHFIQNYSMQLGRLQGSSNQRQFTTVDEEKTDAISLYLSDTITFENLQLTFGGRGELMNSRYQNRREDEADNWLKKQTRVWLYSASGFYTVSKSLGLFAGVHEGFVPTSPKQSTQIKPERSVNYELGLRYNEAQTQLESVLFFNDFNNLKESCSFSTSASCATQNQLDQEFNGGEVDVYGLEFNLQRREYISQYLDVPWSVIYTYSDSEFKQDLNSTFELWGNVTAGDPLPYLAKHQLTFNFGLEANDWQIHLMVKHIDAMPEASGSDTPLSGSETDALTVIDLSASFSLDNHHSLYAKIDNITDEIAIVSRRPYGARPSKPKQIFVGYKYTF